MGSCAPPQSRCLGGCGPRANPRYVKIDLQESPKRSPSSVRTNTRIQSSLRRTHFPCPHHGQHCTRPCAVPSCPPCSQFTLNPRGGSIPRPVIAPPSTATSSGKSLDPFRWTWEGRRTFCALRSFLRFYTGHYLTPHSAPSIYSGPAMPQLEHIAKIMCAASQRVPNSPSIYSSSRTTHHNLYG